MYVEEKENYQESASIKAAVLEKLPDFKFSEPEIQSAVMHIAEKLTPHLEYLKEEPSIISSFDEEQLLKLIDFIVAEMLSLSKNNNSLSRELINSEMMINSIALKAETVICENILNPELSVSFVADKLYISTSYLYRCSMNRFGIPISEYIANCKLEKARELIKNGCCSLSEVAYTLNYCSQSYFSSLFKRKYGVSPMQFKQACIELANKKINEV